MDKEFIPYEQALVLKELGFDESCITCYDKLKSIASHAKNVFDYKNYNTSGYMVSRPTFSQAFRWFRKKYFIHSNIIWLDEPKSWAISIKKMKYYKNIKDKYRSYLSFSTYEEAELECLKKLIELVK